MTIKIQYNKQKTIQALRYHFISRPEVKVLLIVVNVFAVFSAFVFYAHKITASSFMLFSFLWFVLMLFFWFILPRMVFNKNTTFQETIGITFFEKDMEITTARGRAEWAYEKFQYFIESPFFFHLYINERSFFLIPKDAGEPVLHEQEIREFLSKKISRKK